MEIRLYKLLFNCSLILLCCMGFGIAPALLIRLLFFLFGIKGSGIDELFIVMSVIGLIIGLFVAVIIISEYLRKTLLYIPKTEPKKVVVQKESEPLSWKCEWK